MNFLTLEYIKEHSRIEHDCEDTLLTLYAEAAEAVVLGVCNRSLENLTETYGAVPEPLLQAALQLVDLSYMQRSPVSPANLSVVPYTFDMLVKPYMIL